jgi:hypothetical protein
MEAERSTISEMSGAMTASRAGCCQRVERSTFTGASSWVEHRRRDEWSTVGERRRVASELSRAPYARRTEHLQQAERGVVSKPNRASSLEQRAGQSTLSETSRVPSASGTEHRHRSIGDERSTVGERNGTSSPEHQRRAEHRQQGERSTVGEQSRASSLEHPGQ